MFLITKSMSQPDTDHPLRHGQATPLDEREPPTPRGNKP